MTSAFEIFRAYINDPFKFWTGPSLRQAEKLDQKKNRVAQDRGWPLEDLADRLFDLAVDRHCRPAVYITGLGGSGSHWLSGMLGETETFFDAGEVYFPPLLIEYFEREDSTVPLLVDALHLLHARSRVMGRERAVNCAAGATRVSRYIRWDDAASTVYLIRDPRDQVLSTTFRKDEYRSYLGDETADDAAYLSRRCELNHADRRGYLGGGIAADITISYENMRSDPRGSLERVIGAVGEVLDPEALDRIVQKHDADRIIAGERKPIGNLNLDAGMKSWTDEAPRWIAAIHAELVDVIEGLGYPFGRCLLDPPAGSFVRPTEPLPTGVRLRGWVGQDWSLEAANGPWLAEILEGHEGQQHWLRETPLYAVCAVRLGQVSDPWLESVLENPHLRSLDLGTVSLTPSQTDHLAAHGGKLTALGLWRSTTDAALKRIRAELPTTTVVA